MKTKTVALLSQSEEQTREIGRRLGFAAQLGDVFALIGDLGAGKTVLAQGIAHGFGIPPRYAITSPTFTLINEYKGERGILFHLDIYRLAKSSDLADIGADEIIASARGISVVEWADKVLSAMSPETVFIRLKQEREGSRLLEISAPATKIDLMDVKR